MQPEQLLEPGASMWTKKEDYKNVKRCITKNRYTITRP